MPKKKRASEMTDEEILRRVMPKRVAEEMKHETADKDDSDAETPDKQEDR